MDCIHIKIWISDYQINIREVNLYDSGALIVTHNTILLSPRISAHLSPGHIFVRSLSYDMIFPWCNHPHISIRWLKYARPIYLFDERSCFWYVLKVVDGFHFTAFQTVFRRRTICPLYLNLKTVCFLCTYWWDNCVRVNFSLHKYIYLYLSFGFW